LAPENVAVHGGAGNSEAEAAVCEIAAVDARKDTAAAIRGGVVVVDMRSR